VTTFVKAISALPAMMTKILPRRLVGRSGASVVRRNVALSRIGGFGCQSLQRSVRLNPTRHEPVAVVLELMNLV
jgi:hypothetical protein